jgi:hypothetical protein
MRIHLQGTHFIGRIKGLSRHSGVVLTDRGSLEDDVMPEAV